MSVFNEFYFLSSNGRTNIRTRHWMPEGSVRATVQIAHGIAEHCERYNEFCDWLCKNGFAVYINDHLGHGISIYDESELGFFDYNDGWSKVVKDMHSIYDMAASEYPGIPHIILGHSMGSFLTRTYLFTYPNDFNAAVICGTAHMSRSMIKAGYTLASSFAMVSPKKHSAFLEKTAFGAYNQYFEPVRTNFDWLSRDCDAVDKYLADPLCGFTATSSLYADMMSGLIKITDKKNIDKINKDTPILFISGSMDPVGENGSGVKRAYAYFRAAGVKNVELKLYAGARHELLNEINKNEVYTDIVNWINKKILLEEKK